MTWQKSLEGNPAGSGSNIQLRAQILPELSKVEAQEGAHKKKPEKSESEICNIGLFSGGKDSLAACYFLYKKGELNEVVYIRTGVGVNEDYVKRICARYNWKLNIIHPVKNEYEMFCARYGFPRPTSHTWIMQRLKLNPLKKWYREQTKKGRNIILVSGIRKGESKRRARVFKDDKELTLSHKMKFFKPLLNWSNQNVLDFIKKEKIDISEHYALIGTGSDCLCGAFNRKEHGLLLLKYYPKLAKRFLKLEKTCRGSWGQYMGLTDCQKQSTLDGLICNECTINK